MGGGIAATGTRGGAVCAAVVLGFVSVGVAATIRGGGKAAGDCYVVLDGSADGTFTDARRLECLEGDPTCDHDGECGNDTCLFVARICTASPDVAGCNPPRSLESVAVRKGAFPRPASLDGPQCGAYADQVVPLRVRRSGKRPGRLRIAASARAAGVRPAVDRDRYVLICTPRSVDCPVTTSTTSTSVATTSTTTSTSATSSTTSTSATSSTSSSASTSSTSSTSISTSSSSDTSTTESSTTSSSTSTTESITTSSSTTSTTATTTTTSSTTTTTMPCGDGIVDPGEQCDDGTTTPLDGCGSTCQLEPPNSLNETDSPAEADYCNLQLPATFSVTAGHLTTVIYGRLYEASVTPAAGAPAGVLAQGGYGPDGSDPTISTAWRWASASFNAQFGNDDEFQTSFTAPTVSVTTNFAYAFRFSFDAGQSFTYCDLDGAGSNAGLSFSAAMLGRMRVDP